MPEYEERSYRRRVIARGLQCFRVVVKETDLWVCSEQALHRQTRDLVYDARHQIEGYMASHPEFSDALFPIPEDPFAPPVVKEMIRVSRRVNVGPMASVAGVISERVGEGLLEVADQVIVENGGDIFLKADRPLTVCVFAGSSVLSGKVGLQVHERQMPAGVCSSSATVGHSLSRGIADAVCLLSPSAALADAAATALGNRISTARDLERAGEWAREIEGILGGVVIVGGRMASWGDIELVAL